MDLIEKFNEEVVKKENKELRYSIHKILANCMNLITERSGVNFRGQFSAKKSQVLGIGDTMFIRVQQVFNGIKDPYNHFKELTKLERYIENLEKLLDEFSDLETHNNDFFFFTPTEGIFDYQMQDSNFMIYFMGSVIIFSQTLMKPATNSQESVINLLDFHKNKLNIITSRAKGILYKINPLIITEIEDLLESEAPWINWKYNKCLKFEKEAYVEYPGEDKIELEEGEVAGEEITVSKNKPLFEEGERPPIVRNFIERVIVDLNPDEQIEEEFRAKNDPVFTWRLLRLVSFTHIDLFMNMPKIDIEKIAMELKPIYKFNEDIEIKSSGDSENDKKIENQQNDIKSKSEILNSDDNKSDSEQEKKKISGSFEEKHETIIPQKRNSSNNSSPSKYSHTSDEII